MAAQVAKLRERFRLERVILVGDRGMLTEKRIDANVVVTLVRDRDLSRTIRSIYGIERARRMGLPHVYLGYWVEGSRKMDYKARFLPQERLGMQGWERAE